MSFFFFDSYLAVTKLRAFIPTDGPTPSLRFAASSAKHPRWGSLLHIPVWDFLMVCIQNPAQQSNGLFPTPSYQRTLIPAQHHSHLVKQTAEVPRKLCATPELQLLTTLMWVNTILYYFHGSLVCESGIQAVNIIHKASWSCTDKVFFLFV